jgi:hypothetical protein
MKKIMKTIILILAAFACFAMSAGAANRTALVIGNSAYKISPLHNPVNDATDIAAILKDCGFNVMLKLNTDHRTMERSIRDFGKKLRDGGIGLFYYAGHGVQVKGRNYLIPIASEIESEADVKFETVDAGLVLGKMEDAQNDLNIIILDACRNNPFARSFRSADKGLAKMDAPKGSIVAYSTAPGSLAADGEGRNGVYTKHLIRNMQNPQITVEQVFKNVRVAVVSETSNKQIPWEASSLIGTFHFNQPGKAGNGIKQIVKVDQSNDKSYELLFWESIKSSTDAESFKVYLQQFPNGVFAGLAKLRIKQNSKKSNINQTTSSLKDTSKIKSEPNKEGVKLASISPEDKESVIIAKDGQYVKYKSGIVYDEKTGLEWYTGPDKYRGGYAAKKWVKNLNLDDGGWRMPSIRELSGLYKSGAGTRNMLPLLETSGWFVWSSVAGGFSFSYGYYSSASYGNGSGSGSYDSSAGCRAFAVRSRK